MRDFLDFILEPVGYVEVRSIQDGRVRQWWEADRQAAVDLAIRQSDEQWDVYYGALPRLDRGGDATCVAPTASTLWADLDAKMVGSKQVALMSLVRADIPPSVVVDSGHGYHAYWKLESPVFWDLARTAMVGIASALKGDHVYDQARILRIPGTTNWKDPEHPVPVRTIVFDTTNVRDIREFAAWVQMGVDILRPQPRATTLAAYVPPADRADLPSWLVDLIRDGAPQGQRSEQAFKVMAHLARRGWGDGEILDAFEQGGIGEKMREMRGGERWFHRSLERARSQL